VQLSSFDFGSVPCLPSSYSRAIACHLSQPVWAPGMELDALCASSAESSLHFLNTAYSAPNTLNAYDA
jgi:hypothetical protein